MGQDVTVMAKEQNVSILETLHSIYFRSFLFPNVSQNLIALKIKIFIYIIRCSDHSDNFCLEFSSKYIR